MFGIWDLFWILKFVLEFVLEGQFNYLIKVTFPFL